MFQIVKTLNGWFHRYNSGAKSVNISDFEVTLDEVANTFVIVQRNGSNIPLNKLSVNDIEVIDETSGSIVETFTNVIDLKARLQVLGYTAYLGAGNADSITGLIQEGTNVTITGSGTLADPYIISASGGGGTTPTLQEVTDEGNTISDNAIFLNNTLNDNTLVFDSNALSFENPITEDTSGITPTTISLSGINESLSINKTKIRRQIPSFYTDIVFENPTANRTLTIPNESGTIATREWVTANPPSVVVDADDVTETATRVFVTPAQKTILSNTSGTNSGDNATNTTSNAYADAKVEDTIVNGVTDKAPSQNAVFDAFNNLDPLVKRLYFDDFVNLGDNGVGVLIVSGGTFQTDGGLSNITKIGGGTQFTKMPAELNRDGILRATIGNINGNIRIRHSNLWIKSTDSVLFASNFRIQNLSTLTERYTLELRFFNDNNNFISARYSDNINSGNFQFITSLAGVTTTVNTSVNVAINTWYELEIRLINGIATLFINGVAQLPISTNILLNASYDAQWYLIKTISQANVARTVDFDYILFKDL